jgi:hypothetical protein
MLCTQGKHSNRWLHQLPSRSRTAVLHSCTRRVLACQAAPAVNIHHATKQHADVLLLTLAIHSCTSTAAALAECAHPPSTLLLQRPRTRSSNVTAAWLPAAPAADKLLLPRTVAAACRLVPRCRCIADHRSSSCRYAAAAARSRSCLPSSTALRRTDPGMSGAAVCRQHHHRTGPTTPVL